MTKREFIQQAAIHIGAALVKCYHEDHIGFLYIEDKQEQFAKTALCIVSHLADEVGQSQPWDLDFDDLYIDEEVSMEDSV